MILVHAYVLLRKSQPGSLGPIPLSLKQAEQVLLTPLEIAIYALVAVVGQQGAYLHFPGLMPEK